MAATPNMRLASETTKALPRHIKFTVRTLAAILPPAEPEGRVWVYDTEKPFLAFLVTGRNARSFYLARRILGKASRVRIGGAELTISQARAKVDELNGEIVRGINPADRSRKAAKYSNLESLWNAYRTDHVEKECSDKTLIGFKSIWKTCLKPWGGRAFDISEDDAKALHSRLGRVRGRYAANRAIELLRAMYNHGGIQPNPCSKPESFLFGETKRKRFLNRTEMNRLLVALDDESINRDIADIVRLSLFTGARRSNCQAARDEEFDLTDKTWTIPAGKAKGGEELALVLLPQAAKIVRDRMGNESGFLFPSHSQSGHVVEIKHGWVAIKKLAKLDDVRFHDCRRSFASWMAKRGTSLLTIGKALGHASLSATEIYARLDLTDVRPHAAAAVNSMLSAKQKPKGK
jgi:integrase